MNEDAQERSGLLGNAVNRLEQGADVLRNVRRLVSDGDPPIGPTPRELAWSKGRASLWRYGAEPVDGPPVLVVHSLVSKPFILDLLPGNTFVGAMLERGLEPWLLEWGEADARDADNTLATYVDDYLPAAAAVVREATGVDQLAYLGYCFGGTLLQLSVVNPANDLRPRGLATMAAPIDWQAVGFPVRVLLGDLDVEQILDATGNVPVERIDRTFRMLQPTNQLASWADLLAHVDSEKWIIGYEAMKRWIDEQVPFPGALLQQLVDDVFEPNAMLHDGVEVRGLRRRLADIDCPVLVVVAEQDQVVPIEAALPEGLDYGRPMRLLRPDAGHVGLVAGRQAATQTIPSILDWLADPDGEA